MNAKNIVSSFGTFVPSLLYFNENLENYYSFRQNLNKSIFTYNEIIINLDEYFKLVRPWLNSNSQKQIMIDYKIDKNIVT